MAYATSNPPFLLVPRIGGASTNTIGGSFWGYNSSDIMGTVAATSYFSNGAALGMKVGDRVSVVAVSTASPPVYVGHGYGAVSAVTAGAGATIVLVSSST
jgi:hypothetical protein